MVQVQRALLHPLRPMKLTRSKISFDSESSRICKFLVLPYLCSKCFCCVCKLEQLVSHDNSQVAAVANQLTHRSLRA